MHRSACINAASVLDYSITRAAEIVNVYRGVFETVEIMTFCIEMLEKLCP
jgi:hypothetical protein